MLKKTTFLIFSLFLLFISITAICATDNSDLNETLSSDDSDFLTAESGNFTELSDLI